MDEITVPALQSRITGPAADELVDALTFLRQRVGDDSAERLKTRFRAELSALCERVAQEIQDGGRPFAVTDDTASQFFSQPVYRFGVETTKQRARRSSMGLWYAYYAIRDLDGDGNADTISVVAIRHSAAAPFTIDGRDEPEEDNEES